MNFKDEYNNIKNLVESDLSFLEEQIEQVVSKKIPIASDLLAFLSAPSKRLRPLLGFLFLRSALGDVNLNQKKVLLAVELIHNATLIHDDVIDDSEKRRNTETLNSKFSSDLAVVAGDFLLSVAMEKVIEAESIDVLKLFAASLKLVCVGEFNQYFNKFNLTSIDEYIEKSKNKTAVLFKTAIVGSFMLSEFSEREDLLIAAEEFSENFGIAFQIRDDLLNIMNTDLLKPSFNDLNQGIYTAPVIFAYPDGNVSNNEDILEEIKLSGSIEKTKSLMDNYFTKAISALKNIKESPYKSAIIELIELLKTSVKEEKNAIR